MKLGIHTPEQSRYDGPYSISRVKCRPTQTADHFMRVLQIWQAAPDS